MADKDYSELTTITSPADDDLVAVYPVGGPLKKMKWSDFIIKVAAAVSGTYLTVANNLSDIASASAARANLALGTAAQLASSALFQVSNNLSEVANASTARTNLGAAASDAPTITNGMTLSGSNKQNVLAVGALDLDLSASDFFTKSIGAGSTFTFSNPTASKAQGFLLLLTISSSAVPVWPAAVAWPGGVTPSFGNGTFLIGFVTFDGGTNYLGRVST